MESLLRFCTIATAITVSLCCSAFSVKFGNMTEHYAIEVGETLSLRCSLFGHVHFIRGKEYNFTSEDLMIKFGGTFLQKLRSVDEYTVEYILPNASINDSGTYNCFLKVPGLPNQLVCLTDVSVGYKPQKVSNFSCIGYEFERLICSWIKPFNPVKTNYTLNDVSSGYRTPCQSPLGNSCEFRKGRKGNSAMYRLSSEILKFVLVGKNDLGSLVQTMPPIHHYEIVIPSAPQKLTVTNVTTSSVYVEWLMPKNMEYGNFPPGLAFELKYCPSAGNYPKLCGTKSQKDRLSVLVSDLVPGMEYKFSLRCRSNVAEGDDMWSPFTNASIWTEADVPYLAPVVTTSSFHVETSKDNRSITLYWKSIPSFNENGDNFGYVIKCYENHFASHQSQEIAHEDVGNQTSHTFTNMDSNSDYFFQIFANNSIGLSTNSSSIYVGKAANLIEGPFEVSVISYDKGRYEILWEDSDDDHYPPIIMNYTVFWCQNIQTRPFKCEGPIEWKTVLNKNPELNLTDSNTNYQFAVAINTENSTSGLKWASCVAISRHVRYKVQQVILKSRSTNISVRWTLECKAQRSVIKEYVITYCIYTNNSCSGPVFSLRTSEVNYTIDNLQPYTEYKVTVATLTTDGLSEEREQRISTIQDAPSDPPQNVSLISVEGTVIRITFKPPLKPNGKINHYVVYYWDKTMLNDFQKPRISVQNCSSLCEAQLDETSMKFYTNYSIEVIACVTSVDGLPLCSPHSNQIYAVTDVAAPGTMELPHLEVFNSSVVNITWKPPKFPNGPIDYYQLKVSQSDDEFSSTFNVSGHQHFFNLELNCSDQLNNEGIRHQFQIRAINIKNDALLIGNYSKVASTQMCFVGKGLSYPILFGLVFGIAFGLAVLVISMYSLAKWMKKTVDAIKHMGVQLPPGLETSTEINLEPRQEKSDLSKTEDTKASGKRPDSLSSEWTSKTLLSTDSGAELDLPSPDSVFSVTSLNNTPDGVSHPINCTDSGLAIDNASPVTEVTHILYPSSQMLPYSQFSVLSRSFRPRYVSFGVYNVHLMEQSFLSNSEPSVLDSQNSVDSNPVVSGLPPYCQFGLARSTGSGLNIASHSVPMQKNTAYSKFGLICNAVKNPASSSNQAFAGVTPNYSKIACARFMQTEIKSMYPSHQSFVDKQLVKPMNEQAGSNHIKYNFSNSQSNPSHEKAIGHSKPSSGNGYVSFNNAMTNNNASVASAFFSNPEPSSTVTNNPSSGASVTRSSENHPIPSDFQSPVSVHTKPAGYVSFQDAKAILLSEPNAICSDNTSIEGILLPDQMSNNPHSSKDLEGEEDPKEDCGLLVELSNLQVPNVEEFPPVSEITDGPVAEEFGNIPLDVSNLFVSQDLNKCSSDNIKVQESLELSDISLVDIQPQTDDSVPLNATSNSSPIAIKERLGNGYVAWTQLLGDNLSEDASASQAECV